MKRTLKFLFCFALPTLCLASKPDPRTAYCGVLDPLAKLAASRAQNSAFALGALERVALDHAEEIAPDAAEKAGLPQFYLQDGNLRALEARECAIQKIGETALPEAAGFLKTLDHADLGTDEQTVMLLRVAGHVAIRIATLRQIQEPERQIEYLERTAEEMAGSGLGIWAADQLCDRASLASLTTIEKAVRGTWADRRDQEYIDFCKARIFTLYGKPDRVKALSPLLNLQTSGDNPELTTWAIEQLKQIPSPAADAELNRFVREIDSLPDESASKQRVLRFRPLITPVPPRSQR
jgi:hypothetical protein